MVLSFSFFLLEFSAKCPTDKPVLKLTRQKLCGFYSFSAQVVNIEVKPTIKTEDGVFFGSCGMLDMLATVATDPSYTRTRIKTEAASEILPTPLHNSHR